MAAHKIGIALLNKLALRRSVRTHAISIIVESMLNVQFGIIEPDASVLQDIKVMLTVGVKNTNAARHQIV